jgi:hypothetical protein
MGRETIHGVSAIAFSLPHGSPLELGLAPRLESWERHDDPAQVALREFVAHVHERIDPLVDELPGPLAFHLHVGLPENTDPLWERDLDNYLYPIARTLPERVVSMWGTKGRGGSSTVRLEAAVPAVQPMIGFDVARAAPGEGTWKRAVHAAVAAANELPEGPVALQLAFTVGPGVNWQSLWKPSIDGLSPLLGRTYSDREWNPLDGRVVRLGLHKTVDASYGREASMTVHGTVADERWPELAWLAALGPDERSAFVEHRRAKQRNRMARRRRFSSAEPRRTLTRGARDVEIDSANLLVFRDDDSGYLAWIAVNPSGFVLNILRSLNPSTAKVHRAGCRTILGEPARGKVWTGPYIKLCAAELRDLDDWAAGRFGTLIARCGTCRPTVA